MNELTQLLRRPLLHVAAFSLVVNLLLLAPALFMLQVFDRVLVSQSQETLMVLLLGTAIALGIMLALDYLRGRLQGVAGNLVAETLSPVVAKVVLAARAQGGERAAGEGLRDVATLRGLFTAQGLLALFDAPWLLVYVAVIWVFHPVLGIAAAASAVAMLLLTMQCSLRILRKRSRSWGSVAAGSTIRWPIPSRGRKRDRRKGATAARGAVYRTALMV